MNSIPALKAHYFGQFPRRKQQFIKSVPFFHSNAEHKKNISIWSRLQTNAASANIDWSGCGTGHEVGELLVDLPDEHDAVGISRRQMVSLGAELVPERLVVQESGVRAGLNATKVRLDSNQLDVDTCPSGPSET